MSAYARSVCVWLFTGLFSGLGLAMVFAPHRWWLGAIEGFAAAGFIRYAPWLVRQLIRGIVYAVRRTHECRLIHASIGLVLVFGVLWGGVCCLTFPETSATDGMTVLVVPGIVSVVAAVLAIFAVALGLVFLILAYLRPSFRFDEDLYGGARIITKYANPLMIAWYLGRVIFRLFARLYRTTGQSKVLGFATGMALGSSLGYLLGQPAIGMAVGAVAVCLWSWKRQKACPA
jgi:hypothetical protein